MSKKNKIDPEMMSLFKIFGIGSLIFVFILSFFNEKRPNLENQDSLLAINDASRLYFKNVRQPFYDLDGRRDAKMNVYRLGKRVISEEEPVLNVAIIINRIKDEAYLYVEPSTIFESEETIRIRWKSEDGRSSGELEFRNGDRYDHYRFIEELYPLLQDNASFSTEIAGQWYPILINQKERDALRITSFDYFRLIGREEMNR
ncbi:MAG TPA: hypothetical protein VK921_14640 [Anditalea sp.]|nr:hypothetical protein [Anditalea sp.]